jgi:hypothetical protein
MTDATMNLKTLIEKTPDAAAYPPRSQTARESQVQTGARHKSKRDSPSLKDPILECLSLTARRPSPDAYPSAWTAPPTELVPAGGERVPFPAGHLPETAVLRDAVSLPDVSGAAAFGMRARATARLPKRRMKASTTRKARGGRA